MEREQEATDSYRYPPWYTSSRAAGGTTPHGRRRGAGGERVGLPTDHLQEAGALILPSAEDHLLQIMQDEEDEDLELRTALGASCRLDVQLEVGLPILTPMSGNATQCYSSSYSYVMCSYNLLEPCRNC